MTSQILKQQWVEDCIYKKSKLKNATSVMVLDFLKVEKCDAPTKNVKVVNIRNGIVTPISITNGFLVFSMIFFGFV